MSLQIVGTPVRKYPNNVTLPGELDAAGQAEKLPAVRAWKVAISDYFTNANVTGAPSSILSLSGVSLPVVWSIRSTEMLLVF
jgi:hypothetical protein